MIFVPKIEFVEDYRNIKKGTIVSFNNDVTLLIGDQGTGKSSILKILQESNKTKKIICTLNQKCKFLFFDTEKNNPRTSQLTASKDVRLLGFIWTSHGICIKKILEEIKKEKDVLILIDEPESGLSINSQLELVENIKYAIKNNCQVIIATHSIILMKHFNNAFCCENMENISSKEYLGKFQL